MSVRLPVPPTGYLPPQPPGGAVPVPPVAAPMQPSNGASMAPTLNAASATPHAGAPPAPAAGAVPPLVLVSTPPVAGSPTPVAGSAAPVSATKLGLIAFFLTVFGSVLSALANAAGLIHGSVHNLIVLAVGVTVCCAGMTVAVWQQPARHWRISGAVAAVLSIAGMSVLLLLPVVSTPHRSTHRTTHVVVSPPPPHQGNATKATSLADSLAQLVDPPFGVGISPVAAAFVGARNGFALDSSGAVVAFDPSHPELGASTVLGPVAGVTGVAIAGGTSLVARSLSNGVVDIYRNGPAGLTPIAELQPGNLGGCMAIRGPEVWMCNTADSKVNVFNADTREYWPALSVPGRPTAVLITGSDVWVSVDAGNESYVKEFNFIDGRPLHEFRLLATPTALAFDGVHLWVALDDLTIISLDVSTGAQSGPSIHENAEALAVADGELCAVDASAEELTCYDTATHRRAAGPCTLPGEPVGLLPRANILWTAVLPQDEMLALHVPASGRC